MNILIAEDDTFFQKFYRNELEAKGYKVDVAENGKVALEKMHAQKPDFLILDIIMPIKNGFDVLEEMASDTSLKSIPVLVFSTLGQEKDVKRAMELGAKGFVNKSFFDFDALISKIQEVTGTPPPQPQSQEQPKSTEPQPSTTQEKSQQPAEQTKKKE